jgi:hypothetical protein
MSDSSNPRDSPPSPNRRRSSFVDMFSNRTGISPTSNPPRRLSITTLGLSTLPGTQPGPLSAIRGRAESVSSSNSNSVDESPFEDDNVAPGSSASPSAPQSPFARRMSFGAARVMRDSRPGNGAANGRQPSVSSAASSSNATAASTAKSRGLSCCLSQLHYCHWITSDNVATVSQSLLLYKLMLTYV